MTSLESLVTTNANRNEQIIHCRQQIQYWQQRLRKLEREQRKTVMLTQVNRDAAENWPHLRKNEKQNKEFILAALHSPTFPFELPDWIQRNAPKKIREDPEIFILAIQKFNWIAPIPKRFQTSQTILQQVVQYNPTVLDYHAPKIIFQDPIFFRQLITISAVGVFERNLHKFDENIRKNRDLMLQLFQLPNSSLTVQHLHKSLRNDRQLCLEIAKHNRFLELRPLSQKLRADKQVVMAYCKVDGSNLKNASAYLRRDPDVIRVACESTSSCVCPLKWALPGEQKTKLLHDKEFILRMLDAYPGDHRLYQSIPRDLKKSAAFTIRAFVNGTVDTSQLSEEFLRDRSFWVQVLEERPSLWIHYPNRANDLAMAQLALHSIDSMRDTELLVDLLRQWPQLMIDTSTVFSILSLDAPFYFILKELVIELVSRAEIERDFMIDLCRLDGLLLEVVPHALKDDTELLEVAIDSNPHALAFVPDQVQVRYPFIVERALRNPAFDYDEYVLDWIDESLWENRSLAYAWVSHGGDFIDEFPEYYEDDEELFLLFAEHNPDEFWMASERLCSNKSFMLKAIEINESLFDEVSGGLENDFEIMLAAASQTGEFIGEYYLSQSKGKFQQLVAFADHIRSRLEVHKSLVRVLGSVNTTNDRLSILNQGSATTSIIWKKIGIEYLGAPFGEELRHLRRASENLALWGF